MAIKYLSGIDLNGNSLSNAPVQNLATEPAVATFDEGQMYFNTTNNNLYVLADGAFVDLTSQGDITAVALKATGNTGVQLEIASAGGPIPTFEILTGAVADGQNYLVDSQAVFNAISSSGGGTVTSVDGSGGTTGLTLTGGAITSSGTLTLGGTLIPASGGTGQTAYVVGDILYASSTTALSKLGIGSAGQVLKVTSGVPAWAADANAGGTVTSIAFGDGLTGGTITGSGSVALNVSGADNYILQGNNDSGTTLEDGFKIPYSDTSNVVQFGNVSDLPFTANAGTVTSVATGNANTITIGGSAAAPTVAANTAAIAASGTNLATADQINTFVTDFNYSTTVGTVTSVSGGDGIIITGTAAVTPVVRLDYDGADNYIENRGAQAADAEDFIAFSVPDTGTPANTTVKKSALKNVPMAALTAVKTYVDAAVAGSTSFQGGYNAGTNIPGLIPGLMSVTGSVDLDATVTVTGTSTLFTTEFVVGDSIVAGGETRIVSAIASDTSLTVSVDFTVTATDSSPERIPAVITIEKGQQWVVTADGVFFTEQLRVGDLLIANVDAPTALASWTTVQSNVDLATATVAGIASFSADNFLVSAAGAVTIKDNGVILGTETTGAYVETLATGTGLDNTTGTGEGSTPTVSLDFDELDPDIGDMFITLVDGEAVPKKSTANQAATILNAESTFAVTVTATGVVTHSLGTKDVIVQLYDIVTFDTVYADIDRTSNSTITVTFAATPTNSIRVLVQKIG
jgi:hypothetical protein